MNKFINNYFLAILLTFSFSLVVVAQEQEEVVNSTEVSTEVSDVEEDVEEVIVTGSRIKRSPYTTSQPIVTISGVEFDERGYANAADALFDLPSVFVTASPQGEQGGLVAGQRIANNFGLGSGRTVTLINGRRFVSSTPLSYNSAATGAVDLNNIPSSLIERIEVMNSGGSAVYGSDAIAGVINYILKRDFEGADVSVNYNDVYDGATADKSVQFTVGVNSADGRGNVTFAFQREETGDVYYGDIGRLSRCELALRARDFTGPSYQQRYYKLGTRNPRGTGTIDQPPCVTLSYLPFEGRAFATNLGRTIGGKAWAFDKNGDPFAIDFGTDYGSGFFNWGGNLLPGYGDNQTYRSGYDRTNVSVFTTYEITEGVKFFMDIYRNKVNAFENGDATAGPYSYYGFAAFDEASYYYHPIVITRDNPYVTDATGAWMDQYGLTKFMVQKTYRDFYKEWDYKGAPIDSDNNVESTVIGFEGEFQAIDRNFAWDASYTVGQVDLLDRGYDINTNRFVMATDVGINPATGLPDCKMNYVPDYDYGFVYSTQPSSILEALGYSTLGAPGAAGMPGDCAPLNVMGFGAASDEAIAYIMTDSFRMARIKQEIYAYNLSGDVYELPAGTLKFAVGIENRKERGFFDGSDIQNIGLTRSAAREDMEADISIDEEYYEISLPLVSRDMGFAFNGWGILDLRVDYSYRDIDHSSAGSYDVDALNIFWQISDELAFRAGSQTAVRSPDLSIALQPTQTSFQRANDPCDYRFIDTGRNPTVRRANCAAEGLGNNFVSDVVNATAKGLDGGNPNLLNELGDTETFGLIYTPSWTEKFIPGTIQLAVDLIRIEISDTVESFGLGANMNACYDFQSGREKFCSTFTRRADGQVDYFTSGYNNAGVRNFETYIYNLDYGVEVSDLAAAWFGKDGSVDRGSLAIRYRAFNQKAFESAATSVPDDLVDFTGQYDEPEWLYDISVSYSYNKWSGYYQADFTSGGKININQQYDDQYLDFDGNPIDEYKGYFMDSVGLLYRPTDKLLLRLNVNNPFGLDGSEGRFTEEQGLLFSRSINFGLKYSL